jgi:hypothetical protein
MIEGDTVKAKIWYRKEKDLLKNTGKNPLQTEED